MELKDNKDLEEKKEDYSNVGFFDINHPFNRFMSKFGTVVLANILFIIGCIPIVTIGVSMAALNRTMYEYNKYEDIKPTSVFFSAYKSCLVSGILGFVLNMGFLSMGAVGLFFTLHSANLGMMFLGFFFFGLMVFVMICFLAFYYGIIPRFENDVIGHLKNGIIVGTAYVRWGVLIWFLWVIPIGLFYLFPILLVYLGFVWLMFGFALLALITVKIHNRVFMLIKNRETTDEY